MTTPPPAAPHGASSSAWSSSVARLRFLRGFFRHPLAVGSIAPSSRYLSRAVVAPVPATARVVAELGPGTGPITRALLERLGPEATVLALEIDPSFCEVLRRELPDPRLRVIQGPAQRLAERAREAGFPDGVDAVVSGLPFANFPVALRYEMARIAYAGLEVGGVFSAYGYLPFALPPVIRSVFGECHSRHVWRNVPPAFVFSAAKRA